ncbi:hypothetical protein [Undibacterium sp.]|uniref:hypothetical protein n=1 Tax=Undibacterium sp. TaxID=1914977 RepID=UPI00374DC7FE
MTEEQLKAQLDAIYSSTSWKLTSPLRYTAAMLKSSQLRATSVRRVLFGFIRGLGRLPLIRKAGAQILKLVPGLRSRVRNVVLAERLEHLLPRPSLIKQSVGMSELSPSAQAIFIKLQAAMRDSPR